jgi:hypothetical protein
MGPSGAKTRYFLLFPRLKHAEVGLIDQLIGGHFTPRTHFCTRLMLKTGPSWCSIP